MEWSDPAKQAWFSNQKAVIRCSLYVFIFRSFCGLSGRYSGFRGLSHGIKRKHFFERIRNHLGSITCFSGECTQAKKGLSRRQVLLFGEKQ